MPVLELLAAFCTLAGYGLITHGVFIWGVCLTVIGNFLWLWIGYKVNSAGIIFVNLAFIAINAELLLNA